MISSSNSSASRPLSRNKKKQSINDQNIMEQVYAIFQQAQHGTAGHRKLIHALHQLMTETSSSNLNDFCRALVHCFNVILSVKGSEQVATRSLRFLLGFIVWSGEHDTSRGILSAEDAAIHNPTTIMVESLMHYAMAGLDAKDRWTRVRCCQLLVACVNAVDELSDQLWIEFRSRITERLFDKQPAVRVQAIHATARLQSLALNPSDDELLLINSADDSAPLIIRDVLLELLEHDPSPDVRRTALVHLDVLPGSVLEAILLRRRDTDVSVRRSLYSRKMDEIDARMLSIQQRDELLRSGLADRDPSVRKACVEMLFGRWIRVADNNLLQLIFSLDVVVNTKVAESALLSFYELAPNIFSQPFPSIYFENLTPETAIALRVFCTSQKDRESVVDLLPELSTITKHLRRLYDQLTSSISACEASRAAEDAAILADVEFMVTEMFQVTSLLDVADEAGRRTLLQLLLEMMGNLQLGSAVYSAALQLCVSVCSKEDLVGTLGQLITDLYSIASINVDQSDELEGGDSELQHSLESLCITNGTISQDLRILAQMRCLEIVSMLLTKRQSVLLTSLEEAIPPLLASVVVPSINSNFAAVQEAGLKALALACCSDPTMAMEYLNLFAEFFQKGADEVRRTALIALFDLLAVHGKYSLTAITDATSGTVTPTITDGEINSIAAIKDVVEKTLHVAVTALYDTDGEMQALAAEGFAKLLLHGIIQCNELGNNTASDILGALFQLYVHPGTSNNDRLRQALSYFFQAFAYSSADRQVSLAIAALPHISESAVALQLVELTDPVNLVASVTSNDASINAHQTLADLAIWKALEDAVQASTNHSVPISQRRLSSAACSILVRLNYNNSWSVSQIKRLLFLMGHLIRLVANLSSSGALLGQLKKTVATLVEFDDPSVLLDPEDMQSMRLRLQEINFDEAASGGLGSSKISNRPAISKPNARKTATDAGMLSNVMDDIADLLED